MRFATRFVQDGGWWLAEVPAFRGAVTQGKTLDEAHTMAVDLIRLHVEDRWETGQEVRSDRALPKGDGWEWVEIPLRVLTAMQIRRERQRRHMTMQQAADALGVTPSTYQKWEDPRRCNPTMDTLERVAQAFGRRAELLFL